MTCRHAELQLNALADNELPPWQASRVRRHLAACPACAAQLAEIKRLGASVQAWRNVPAPSNLGPRIAAALPPSAAFQTRRRAFPIRPAAVGLAGVAATVAAAVWFLPGQPGQPAIAYADVQRAMQQVQTASWTTHDSSTDANWRVLGVGPEIVIWARRSPPAIARFGQPYGFKSLLDGRGSLQRTAQGNYLSLRFGKRGKADLLKEVDEKIRSLTQNPDEEASIPHHTAVRNPQQRSVLIDGRKQILFTFDNEVVIHKFVFRGRTIIPEAHYFSRNSTWVDPTTRLVVRREIRTWGDNTSGQFNTRRIVISTNFHYNQAPPPGIFDWSPPPGANVITMNDLRTDKRLRLYLPKKKLGK